VTVGKSLLAGLALGALVAVFMCHVALADNNQGEFADTITGVYTAELYKLFAVWTLVTGLAAGLFLALLGYLWRADD
jgi:cytochrome bd-type quinol oxidase subunit 2